ncbi:MAG TPA: hypothetical protein VE713_09995, partial [Pyrinomonadaceae bacterium]|nr:hypothetical protein [Pyrinomonadaceae bacterium]
MRGNNSPARRESLRRGGKLFGVARRAGALALLLALAAPTLFYGFARAGAQSRKSAATDESAQDSKARPARKAKGQKDQAADDG